MQGRSLLADAVIDARVDAGILAGHLEAVETWLAPVAGDAELVQLSEQFRDAIEARDPVVMARIARSPGRLGVAFAYLPARRMLEVFDALEQADDRLLPAAVEAATGRVGILARARLGFLTAVSTLCRMMSLRYGQPTAPGG